MVKGGVRVARQVACGGVMVRLTAEYDESQASSSCTSNGTSTTCALLATVHASTTTGTNMLVPLPVRKSKRELTKY